MYECAYVVCVCVCVCADCSCVDDVHVAMACVFMMYSCNLSIFIYLQVYY